jgi:hypothetical protein
MVIIEVFERRYPPARRHPRRHHPGHRRRDPARPDADTIQRKSAPGSKPACADATHNRTSQHQSRHVCFWTSDFATHIRTIRSQMRPLLGSTLSPRPGSKQLSP